MTGRLEHYESQDEGATRAIQEMTRNRDDQAALVKHIYDRGQEMLHNEAVQQAAMAQKEELAVGYAMKMQNELVEATQRIQQLESSQRNERTMSSSLSIVQVENSELRAAVAARERYAMTLNGEILERERLLSLRDSGHANEKQEIIIQGQQEVTRSWFPSSKADGRGECVLRSEESGTEDYYAGWLSEVQVRGFREERTKMSGRARTPSESGRASPMNVTETSEYYESIIENKNVLLTELHEELEAILKERQSASGSEVVSYDQYKRSPYAIHMQNLCTRLNNQIAYEENECYTLRNQIIENGNRAVELRSSYRKPRWLPLVTRWRPRWKR